MKVVLFLVSGSMSSVQGINPFKVNSPIVFCSTSPLSSSLSLFSFFISIVDFEFLFVVDSLIIFFESAFIINALPLKYINLGKSVRTNHLFLGTRPFFLYKTPILIILSSGFKKSETNRTD
eukprot:NODE_84_length_22354_cov_0.646506.p19 type:complete len:121 gc:universal NODE_84_length_22354_cov_0.646506:4235-4597(+)